MNPSGPHRGFGLAEIMISMAIFSTGFLYVLGTITGANHAIKQSADSLIAQDLAEQVMEDYKGRPYAALPGAASGQWLGRFENNGIPVTLTYLYQVDISEYTLAAPFTDRKMKRINVQVNWDTRYLGRDRKVRQVVLQTAVGQ
jgi:prepilin-type N-terminal cleavage/methylation domain-containing protein